jgi:hypothetical protein
MQKVLKGFFKFLPSPNSYLLIKDVFGIMHNLIQVNLSNIKDIVEYQYIGEMLIE